MYTENQITVKKTPGVFIYSICLFFLTATTDLSAQTLASDSAAVDAILAANGIGSDQIFLHVIARDGRIEELRLNDMNLMFLTGDLGDLTALTYLDLSGNLLESLPNEIGNLRNLRTLNLQNNRLATLPAGITSVPTSYSYQTTEYGCQITYDGVCIQEGQVLVTHTGNLNADLSNNQLCNESGSTATWATNADPDWLSTQCAAPVFKGLTSTVLSPRVKYVLHNGQWLIEYQGKFPGRSLMVRLNGMEHKP